ncbi:MAG TPA: glycosyltransferase family 4 protein [Acidimicrobiales bacterium]|nr:glycosyltransferase family 4 protein [Acidimicrobiales bacterium]
MSKRPAGKAKRPSGRVTPGGRATTRAITNEWRGSVAWLAPFFNPSGFGEEARGLVRNLVKRQIPIKIMSADDSPDFVDNLRHDPPLAILLNEALNRPTVAPITAVAHLPIRAIYRVPFAAVTVGRAMFETDGLPAECVARLNTLDEVWVPGHFNLDTFTRAGVRVPMHVVPGGVDASAYRPGLKPLPIVGTRGTVFMSVFEWGHRKAPDLLLRAWADAFRPDADVSLVIRSYLPHYYGGDNASAVYALIDEQLAQFGRTRADVAPIVVVGQQLTTEAMPRFMAAADVYVGAARGEGWGRPLHEAMSCGLPVIATNWGGNTDFMNEANSRLISIDGLVPVDDRMPVEAFRGQMWAEPSVGELTEALRELAADGQMRRTIGRRARADIERQWQWHQVAPRAEDRLRALSGNTPYAVGADLTATGAPSRIRWVGDVFADHSLAGVSRELVSRLGRTHELPVEAVSSELPPYPADNALQLADVPGAGRARPDGPIAFEVRHFWPPDFTPAAQGRLVVIQPWEYGGIPGSWVEAIAQNVEEMWVPTSWVRDCYLRSGVPADKVAVVPNGVDTDLFHPDGPRLHLQTTRTKKLLFVGGVISRKGFDLVLNGYRAAFGPDDDVCLVVKPFGTDGVYSGNNLDDELRAAAADPDGPAIEIIDRRLTKAEMAALYRSADVLVHPYRGEGFGLPVAEAMACGRPTIVTNYGACLDFCDHTTSWLVPAIETHGGLADMGPSPAGYWWAEPDLEQLVGLMRTAVTDQEQAAAKGGAGRERIASRFTWDVAAQAAATRLADLSSPAAADEVLVAR